MRASPPFLVALYLIFCVLPVQTTDLTKIGRVIAKEPNYRGKPKYCLLVFGPEAKFRVWLVLDGDVLYVDRNGNGDLTETGERVLAGPRGLKPGKIGKYDLQQIWRHKDGSCDMSLWLDGEKWYSRVGFDGPGSLRFADRAQDAPIIHFLGPLTLCRFEPQARSVSSHLTQEPLVRGQFYNLAFSLGTPGLGNGTFAKYPYDERQPAALAEIRFPNGRTITASLKPDV